MLKNILLHQIQCNLYKNLNHLFYRNGQANPKNHMKMQENKYGKNMLKDSDILIGKPTIKLW